MAHVLAHPRTTRTHKAWIIFSLGASLMLGACADTSALLPETSAMLASSDEQPANTANQTELQKATEYWGKEYTKKPTDKTAALSYARNLKALGEKRKALMVMQQVSELHGADPEVAGEYGRLALEFDQLNVATRMLQIADDPTKPDWKVISARGTTLAKQGQYKQAIPFYERALTLAPNQSTVLNNLALANAMSGDASKAEEILRQASASGANANAGDNAKVQQNLALVLGLQGKYDEAKSLGSKSLSADAASANTDLIRKIVKLDPKAAPASTSVAAAPGFTTNVVQTANAPALKPAAIDNSASASWQTDVASTQQNTVAFKGSAR